MNAKLKKAWHGFLAGVTSPDVVKAEKYVAVTVITRVLVAAGGTAGLVALLTKL